MATLKVSNILLEQEPQLLEVLSSYFDKIEPLPKNNILCAYDNLRQVTSYIVEKDGLPTDDTQVDVVMTRVNGKPEVVEVKF